MLNLFQGGDADAGPADSLRVVTLVDRGMQEAKSLDADPAMQAELSSRSAASTRSWETSTAPIRCCNRARRAARLLGPEHPRRRSESRRARLPSRSQAKYAEAERLIREGLAMSRRRLSTAAIRWC